MHANSTRVTGSPLFPPPPHAGSGEGAGLEGSALPPKGRAADSVGFRLSQVEKVPLGIAGPRLIGGTHILKTLLLLGSVIQI